MARGFPKFTANFLHKVVLIVVLNCRFLDRVETSINQTGASENPRLATLAEEVSIPTSCRIRERSYEGMQVWTVVANLCYLAFLSQSDDTLQGLFGHELNTL